MKKTVILLFVFLVTLQAQSQEIRDLNVFEYPEVNGVYYKDIHNYLSPFQGTYLYTNGNTTLKIILKKQLKHFTGRYYTDKIIGEVLYIENGVQKVNTLANINLNVYHVIQGEYVYDKNDFHIPDCDDCLHNEKRLRVTFRESNSRCRANIDIKRILDVSGQYIRIFIRKEGPMFYETGTTPCDAPLPHGEFILTKQ